MGDSDKVLLVGPIAPATQRGRAVGGGGGIGDGADDAGRGAVHLVGQRDRFGAIIGLADRGGVEGVGGEDVGAGIGEPLADGADRCRAG